MVEKAVDTLLQEELKLVRHHKETPELLKLSQGDFEMLLIKCRSEDKRAIEV